MAQLTCSACHGAVGETDVTCPGCGSLLGVPGAITRAEEPSHPTVPLQATPSDAPTICSTPGCGQPVMRGRTLCRGCFVRRDTTRDYVILAPWGERLPVAEGQTLAIGRNPEFSPFAVHLDNAQFLSGRHAFFSCVEGRLTVRDLDSFNGTRVNAVRIKPQQEIQLVTGDIVTLGGQVQFVVA